MRETWGPVFFATALCVIALVGTIFRHWEAVAPAFFCFLPIVFYQFMLTIQALSKRVAELESRSE